MDTIEVTKILQQGESQTVEFKESFNDEAIETIGAFSNALGGIILIGVKDDGNVCGFKIGKKTLEDIANRIKEATDPRLQPLLSTIDYNNNVILIVDVSSSSGILVSIRGRFFKRTGKSNQRMSHEEIIQRMSSSIELSWTSLVEPSASLDFLEPTLIDDFIATVKKINRRPLPENASHFEILNKLELIKDNKPTRAAMLLFGTEHKACFPSAFIKIGRFRSPTIILDDKEVRGSLFQQLEEVMNWFRDRLETAFVITGSPQREVRWEYPLEAIREAVINMLAHRDYKSSAHSQIRLYDDHLSIWNAGGLPHSLTPDLLFLEHDSIARNPRIAEAFYYTGLIEKWGSGTLRIVEELSKSKQPRPEFISETGRFKVIFHKEYDLEQYYADKNLSARQMKSIYHVRSHGSISNSEYQSINNVSKRTANRDINELISKDIFVAEKGKPGEPKQIYKLKQGH